MEATGVIVMLKTSMYSSTMKKIIFINFQK